MVQTITCAKNSRFKYEVGQSLMIALNLTLTDISSNMSEFDIPKWMQDYKKIK